MVKDLKINRLHQQRRKAAIARGVGDNPARERKQDARTFYQQKSLKRFLWHIADAEQSGVDEFDQKSLFVVVRRGS